MSRILTAVLIAMIALFAAPTAQANVAAGAGRAPMVNQAHQSAVKLDRERQLVQSAYSQNEDASSDGDRNAFVGLALIRIMMFVVGIIFGLVMLIMRIMRVVRGAATIFANPVQQQPAGNYTFRHGSDSIEPMDIDAKFEAAIKRQATAAQSATDQPVAAQSAAQPTQFAAPNMARPTSAGGQRQRQSFGRR